MRLPVRRLLRLYAFAGLTVCVVVTLASIAGSSRGEPEPPDAKWLRTTLASCLQGQDAGAALAVAQALAERGSAQDTLPFLAASEWALGGGKWEPMDVGGAPLELMSSGRLREGVVGRRPDKIIEILTMPKREVVRQEIDPAHVDCDVVVRLSSGAVACGSRDGTVRLRTEDGSWLRLAKLDGKVTQLAELGLGGLAVAHGRALITVLGLSGGSRIAQFRHSGFPVVQLHGLHSSQTVLVHQLGEPSLTCWRVGEGEPVWTCPGAVARVLVDRKRDVVVTSIKGGSIACFGASDGSEKWRVAGDGTETLDLDAAFGAGIVAVVTNGKHLYLLNVETGERLLTSALGPEIPYEVILAGTGDFVVVSGIEGQITMALRLEEHWCVLPVCRLAAPVALLGCAGSERDPVALTPEGRVVRWGHGSLRDLLERVRQASARNPVQLTGKRFVTRLPGDN